MSKLKFIIFAVIALFLLASYFVIKPYYDFLTKIVKVSPIKTLLSFDSLKTYNNQVTILILGIAGGNHDGPNLSDTIIVANYNLKSNKLTTISIPRDIWSATLQDKINSAYAYGEAKEVGGGFKLAKAEIGSVVGIPLTYAAVIDFDKFTKFIDFLGGVDVNVERSFVDHQFPIAGKENDPCGGDPEYKCRYETISFTKGMTHMDGATALNFVRSRHAEGEEGTDFAREQRQQKVLQAVKNKVLTLIKQKDLNKLKQLYQEANNLVKRDITNQQVAIIAKDIVFERNFLQTGITLGENFFNVPSYNQYNGQYVLIPTTGSFDLIHQYIQCYINSEKNCENLYPSAQNNQ